MSVLDRGLWRSSRVVWVLLRILSFEVGSDVCRCQALGSCDFIYMKRIGKETSCFHLGMERENILFSIEPEKTK
jgi:hypothetical protein